MNCSSIIQGGLRICEHLPAPGYRIYTVMRACWGFCAVVLVPLVVDWKIVQVRSQALQTPHTQITSDMDVRSPKMSHHVANYSCMLWKQVSGEQGNSCEPSRSRELPSSQTGETGGSAMRSREYGGLGQPLLGLWSYQYQILQQHEYWEL